MEHARVAEVLRQGSQWQLAEGCWGQIDRALSAVEQALRSGVENAISLTVRDLELAGTLRIRTRPGDPPRAPPPPETRELRRAFVDQERMRGWVVRGRMISAAT
ncbi:CATRA system-associated protein [Nonomuraea jabiensis]